METKKQGVRFVGIDVRDNDAAAIAFERRYKVTYPSITIAGAGQAILTFDSMLPRSAIPSTLVVDREGRLAARVVAGSRMTPCTRSLRTAVAKRRGRTTNQ